MPSLEGYVKSAIITGIFLGSVGAGAEMYWRNKINLANPEVRRVYGIEEQTQEMGYLTSIAPNIQQKGVRDRFINFLKEESERLNKERHAIVSNTLSAETIELNYGYSRYAAYSNKVMSIGYHVLLFGTVLSGIGLIFTKKI